MLWREITRLIEFIFLTRWIFNTVQKIYLTEIEIRMAGRVTRKRASTYFKFCKLTLSVKEFFILLLLQIVTFHV